MTEEMKLWKKKQQIKYEMMTKIKELGTLRFNEETKLKILDIVNEVVEEHGGGLVYEEPSLSIKEDEFILKWEGSVFNIGNK